MGLFSKDVEVSSTIAAVIIGSESSDRKQIAKMQDALLKLLVPGEHLVWVSADVVYNDGIMALTDQRILRSSGRDIAYIVPGDRVARSTIKVKDFYGGKHSKMHAVHVTFIGGPLKHQTIKNFELPNDFLSIWRWEYDEANRMCNLIDKQFGLG